MKMEYVLAVPNVDVKSPLIYMWEIHDSAERLVGRYIGKANGGARRPTQHYPRNVNKLLMGHPYKKGKNYRRVHFALADAVMARHRITLSYLCNVPDDVDILKVESNYIEKYGCHAGDGIGLNGIWRGDAPETAYASAARLREAVHDSAQILAQEEPPVTLELDDFIEYFEDIYRDIFEIRVNKESCSIWIKGTDLRILRAKQERPTGPIRLKRVQNFKLKKVRDSKWDGSDEQLEQAIAAEREVLRAQGCDPAF